MLPSPDFFLLILSSNSLIDEFHDKKYEFRSGQLGLGDTDSRVWPSNVKALQQQKVTYASCGEKHSVVITLDGGVFSFGSSVHGQLGHNSTNDELLPRKISELMGSEVSQVACGRSHTVIFMPNTGQISTFGLACSGRVDAKATSCTLIPQKLALPFLPYKTMKQFQRQTSIDRNSTTTTTMSNSPLYRKQKTPEIKPTSLQVTGIHAGGNQIFIRVVSRAQKPDDYRTFANIRPLLELTSDFAKWLSQTPDNNDSFKDIEKFVDLPFFSKIQSTKCHFRKLSRMFNTEACLNGSFLALPDMHYRTSSSNPGIDLDKVIAVMDKLRTCDPKIEQLVRYSYLSQEYFKFSTKWNFFKFSWDKLKF